MAMSFLPKILWQSIVYSFTKKRSIVLCVIFFLYCNVALFFLLCESRLLTKYSQLSLRRRPLGPHQLSVLERVKQREERKAGTNSWCPFYRGVRLIEVPVKRESTVLKCPLQRENKQVKCRAWGRESVRNSESP